MMKNIRNNVEGFNEEMVEISKSIIFRLICDLILYLIVEKCVSCDLCYLLILSFKFLDLINNFVLITKTATADL